MVMTVKLKHVDELSGGRIRFRRRWPKDVAQAIGESYLQRPLSTRSGPALITEHSALMKEFEDTLSSVRMSVKERGRLSPRERWSLAKQEAVRLVEGSIGDEDTIQEVVADGISQQGGDPLLFKAVTQPESEPPAPTLADAWALYAQDRITPEQGRNAVNRLERVRRRAEDVLGSLAGLPLESLRRQHGRALKTHLNEARTSTQQPLAPETIRRELSMVRAIVELGLVEFDLVGSVANPFRRLEAPNTDAAPKLEQSARLPLPNEVVLTVRERLERGTRRPELALIWRLLETTGCRPSEIGGLRVEDVRLDHDYPHIRVTWHADRRIKTASSHRLVPLVGDALAAAKEAVEEANGEALLFDHYAREAGAERLSAALNKHVRAASTDKRHVVYSLRHNFKDKLISAGADQRIEHRIMGHAAGSLGDRVYGSEEAWLKVATEVAQKALCPE